VIDSTRAAVAPLELEDGLVLAAAVALPWAFGGVAPWAYRSAALLLVLAFAVVWLRRGSLGLALDRRARWLLPAALLGGWAALQLVPLPAVVVGQLSPRAAALERQTFPDLAGIPPGPPAERIELLALEQVEELRGRTPAARPDDAPLAHPRGRWSGWRPLSLLPEAGAERLHWYVALLAVFVVVRARAADREVAAAYRWLLFASFLALALLGLVHAATAQGTVYWTRRTIESSRPFGPYVNPAHFAGVMELAVPWLAGATWDAWRQARRSGFRGSGAPLLVAATLLCLSAGLATSSKAAPLLLGGSLAALALLLARSTRARLATAGVIVVVVGMAVFGARILPSSERVGDLLATTGRDPMQVDRVVAWGAALPMLRDFAITGCGYGAFGDVFPAYLPTGERLRWEQMHNDFLEAALSGGAIGTGLLLWLLGGYARRAARRLADARRAADGATVGLGLGLVALTAHALFDFNHQIPANALLFVVLAALAVAGADDGSEGR